MNFVAIDFETANGSKASACAIGIAIVRDGVLAGTESRLIRPPSAEFSPRNVRIHGITWDRVKGEPDFPQVWQDLLPGMAGARGLVAHCSGFDSAVLRSCCRRYGMGPPIHPFACSHRAAKAVWPLPAYSLDYICSFLGIPLLHHDARSDAEASARIMLAAIEQGYEPFQKAPEPPPRRG